MNVGDYVRFDGEIAKIRDIKRYKTKEDIYIFDRILDLSEDRACNDNTIYNSQWKYFDNVKSSPNIIDILEEHDFVQMEDRGIRFYEIEKDYTGKLSLRDIGWNEYEELDETNIPEIVSIITHEQMEQIKYKVGE